MMELQTPLPRPRDARRRWIEGALITLFWGLIALLTIGQRTIDPWFGEPGIVRPGEVLHSGLEYLVWALLTPIIFWLAHHYSFEREDVPRRLAVHLTVATVLVVSINAMNHVTFQVLILQRGLVHFSFIDSISSLRWVDELIVYLVVLAAGFARDYFLRYRERLVETTQLRTHAAELQTQLAEARLQALRMQINPHFLFNTLHAISALVERDPRGVRRMIARLSDLLRLTLDGSETLEGPFSQELKFLEGYLDIQRIRFQDKLRVTYDVEPEVLDALVPTLILQPLVENAIKHGVSPADGVGQIEITARRVGDRLHLGVRDHGPGLGQPAGDGAPPPGTGVGLRNVRERLENLYGESQQFVLEPAEQGGLRARVVIPFHTGADLRTRALNVHETSPAR